ncbi:CoA transferase [Roseomonas sp. BN140053]|uniref:CoA transferase n=1 Tax=Roseomonas sp. BN140053 TaxID=3391898 RepID=UPI0039EB24C8
MPSTTRTVARDLWQALGGAAPVVERLVLSGEGALPSAFRVTDLAAASVAVAALALAELLGQDAAAIPEVAVDRRLAAFWFGTSLRPVGWTLPAAWDPIAGDYRARDGWIRLHTNAPHHRAAAEAVLGRHPGKPGMAGAVAAWDADALEAAVLGAGGCAAALRTPAAWAAHPQGRAVAAEPLVAATAGDRAPLRWQPRRDRPLAGLRVLDLTRVLAGPVASRFLAGFGADVLRIDPPGWDEPGVVPEVTPGKRCARLDLRDAADRERFEALLARADILLHGYRPGALDGLGYDAARRRALSPGLIDVSLDAYGWTGPWAGRRGFDSLLQMSTGIAQAGMAWKGAEVPVPLPVQALDHATGYLMAAAALRALGRRAAAGEGSAARLSLARTAALLTGLGEQLPAPPPAPEDAADLHPVPEHTAWGEARRLRPPVAVAGAPMAWDRPAQELGSAAAAWGGA